MGRADWTYTQLKGRHPFTMVGTSQVYPVGTPAYVSRLWVLAGAAATTVTVRARGPSGDIIGKRSAAAGNRMTFGGFWTSSGLHVTVSESDAIIMGVGTAGFDTSLLVDTVTVADPTGDSGVELDLPEGSLFTDSITTQDQASAVVLPGDGSEWVNFGNQTEINGATKFTKVWRAQWRGDAQERFHGRHDGPGGKFGWLFRHNNLLGEMSFMISGNGTRYAAFKKSALLEALNTWTVAIVYDGSLGGTDGIDRLKVYRDTGSGFGQLTWNELFLGSGATEVPTSVVAHGSLDELMGRYVGGGGQDWDGYVYTHASVIGVAMDATELDAYPWTNEASFTAEQRNDWDRLYFFQGNLGDQLNAAPGVFEVP